jgi:hypothetical protein
MKPSRIRNGDRAMIAAAAMLALALTGCSSTERVLGSLGLPGTSSNQPSDLVGTPRAQAATNSASDIDPKTNCPVTDVRRGASTYTVNAPGADRTALDLRYQATINRLARECSMLGATMKIKVGVQGNVILGPAGGPGEFAVPLRYALVMEGTEPKTIATKFYRVPVVIPPGQGNVAFTHVEDDLIFPTPPLVELENYVVYVGFDPQMMDQKPKRASKPARKRKR